MEHARQTRAKPTEILGSYDPHTNTARLREERIKYWLTKGAKPSPTIHNILVEQNVIEEPKQSAWKPKKKSEEKSSEEKQDTKEKNAA